MPTNKQAQEYIEYLQEFAKSEFFQTIINSSYNCKGELINNKTKEKIDVDKLIMNCPYF